MPRQSLVFGYARISTRKQSIGRQLENIKKAYPDAIMFQDEFTGTRLDRPAFQRMMKQVQPGDTIVFDEVSRMSRNAEDGYALYEELFEKGIELVFLKEPHINTATYKEALQANIQLTGTDVDEILIGINKYLKRLAKKQIELAFQTAQAEIDYLHKRTSEGVRRAQAAGKRVGIEKGRKLTTHKSIEAKEIIMKYAKDFGGSMKDIEVMKLAGISKNSYYKYKKELLESLDDES
ncbi:MAG: recombinase family protein [Lachnospiraceae bacterium]|nr:recombinase family protein [Lachnospiraceae bacterium]